MFQKNLESLKLKNKKLVAQLTNISIDEVKKDIVVLNSEAGDVIISYKGVVLDSQFDPQRECKTIWNKNVRTEPKKNDLQLIFGTGLGYLFKRAYVSCDSRIVIYEPNLAILRFVFEYIDFTDELKDPRVFITNDYEECLDLIKQKFLSGDSLNFLYLPSYAQVSPNELIKLSSNLVEIIEQKALDSNTVINLSKMWTQVSLQNLKYLPDCTSFNSLEGKFEGKTALIVSAGPSLKDDIEIIKNNRDKFLLIAVNRALKTLSDNQIKPDFVVYTDVRAILPYNKEIGISKERQKFLPMCQEILKDINVIADTRARLAIYCYPTASKFVYSTQNDWLGKYIVEKGSFKAYKTAGSVSITAYYIAKALGCFDIIYSGLDLAIINNKNYIDSEKIDIKDSELIQVKNVKGEEIPSKKDYVLFKRQFEEILEENKEERVYNTSLSGAFVKGMTYLSLEEILKSKQSEDLDVKSIIQESYNVTDSKWQEVLKKIENFIREEEVLFVEIKSALPNLIEQIDNLLVTLENKEVENLDLEGQNILAADIIKKIVQSPILFQYCQKEILEYTNISRKETFMNINTLKAIKQSENNIFKLLNTSMNNFLNSMSQVNYE